MPTVLPGPGVPEDAPGWAIRLEAKLDIAIAQHGQAIDALGREVERGHNDRERDLERQDATNKDLDGRLDVLERTPYVTTKGMWAALASSVAVVAGVVTLVSQLSNIF